MNVAELDRYETLERDWDLKLGGAGTRPFREVLAFAAGRLRGNGASTADVVGYLQLLLSEYDAAASQRRGQS